MPNWWIFSRQLINRMNSLLQEHRDVFLDRIFMTPDWHLWTRLQHKHVNTNKFIFELQWYKIRTSMDVFFTICIN